MGNRGVDDDDDDGDCCWYFRYLCSVASERFRSCQQPIRAYPVLDNAIWPIMTAMKMLNDDADRS